MFSQIVEVGIHLSVPYTCQDEPPLEEIDPTPEQSGELLGTVCQQHDAAFAIRSHVSEVTNEPIAGTRIN